MKRVQAALLKMPRSAMKLLSAFSLAVVLLLCVRTLQMGGPISAPVLRHRMANATVNDPAVCVISRTNLASLARTSASLLSLASSGYPRLHLFLLRTGVHESSDPHEFEVLAARLNELLGDPVVDVLKLQPNAALHLFPKASREEVLLVSVDEAMEQLMVASVRDFCSSDWDIVTDTASELRARHPICSRDLIRPLCDYFLFAEADLYSSMLFPSTVDAMRNKRVAVAWDYVLSRHCASTTPSSCHEEAITTRHVTTAWQPQQIEMGAALVRVDYLRARPSMRFAAHKLRDGKRLTADELASAAGVFYARIASEKNHLKEDLIIVHQTWMLQQTEIEAKGEPEVKKI